MESENVNKTNDSELLSKGDFFKSCVFGSKQTLTFQNQAWISITDFVNIDKSKKLTKNFPHGLTEDGETIFLGKTRSILSQSNRVTDQIGTVKRSSRKMEIVHRNRVFEIQSFLVIGFRDLNNCQWKMVDLEEAKTMPNYALRVGKLVISSLLLT